jgi:hypothetical protein
MMDILAITALASSIGAILVAVYTHVKHSSCCGFTIDTYSPSELQPQIIVNTPYNTPHNTPELKHSNETSI